MEKHIVIIEDDEGTLRAMTKVLEKAGYRVTGLSALSTIEALIELQADCFIIDEQLPYVTGHIICIMLKSKPPTNSIPVILISGYCELEGYARLCKAEAFLQKPFLHISDLVDLVSSMIAP